MLKSVRNSIIFHWKFVLSKQYSIFVKVSNGNNIQITDGIIIISKIGTQPPPYIYIG